MKTERLIPMPGLILLFGAPAWGAPAAFEVCTDYHCDILKPVRLNEQQWQPVRQLFRQPLTAAEEREQIKRAIARLEQQVGELVGTSVDLAENDGEGSEPGQLDCIAESINSTTYLQLMARDNLLKWHRVMTRERRNPWYFDIHWTATILDTTSQQRYAVDSWFYENGRPPVIQPLEAWLDGQDFGQN